MINRKIAISAVSILSAVTMLGSSAFAVFSSQATNNNNSFGTGTLVLQINGQSPTSTGIINVTGKMPGDTVSGALELHNNGSVPASSVQVTGFTLGGNTELAPKLNVVFFADTNANGIQDNGEASLGASTMDNVVWNGYTLPGVTLSANSSYHLGMSVNFDQSADSTLQNKSMTFTVGFQANQ